MRTAKNIQDDIYKKNARTVEVKIFEALNTESGSVTFDKNLLNGPVRKEMLDAGYVILSEDDFDVTVDLLTFNNEQKNCLYELKITGDFEEQKIVQRLLQENGYEVKTRSKWKKNGGNLDYFIVIFNEPELPEYRKNEPGK